MRRRLVVLCAVVALAGCGGGGGGETGSDQGSTKPSGQSSTSTSTSTQAKAVDAWAQAAQAYSDDFRNCGTRAYPTRDFFSACTKKTRRTFGRAEDAALRAIKLPKTPACKRVRQRLSAVMARTGAALERTVLAFDRSNNATLEHRSYSGPPPQQLYLRAAQELQAGAPEAKRLSREIDAGC